MNNAFVILSIALFSLIAWASPKKNSTKISCQSKIIVAPPLVHDPLLSEELALLVQKFLVQNVGLPCLTKRFVGRELAREIFDYVGINAYFGSPARLLNNQVKKIAVDSGATHIVEATWNETRRQLTVTVSAIRDHEYLEIIKTFSKTLSPGESQQLRHSSWLVKNLALWTPNSVTIGLVTSQVDFDSRIDGYEIVKTEYRSKWPRIFSSVGFNKIEHVQSFSRYFDLGASLFPGSYMFAIDQKTTFANPKLAHESDVNTASIRIYGVCTNLNAMGLVRTPLGTTYFGTGVGPCLFHRQADKEKANWIFDGAIRGIIGHRAFWTQHVYQFFDMDWLIFREPIYKSSFAKAFDIARITLGFGFYLPDVEHRHATVLSSWLD